MQLICETLFPPWMSVTITFLTYSSYTSQSIAVVTTAPVFCQSATRQWRTQDFILMDINLTEYMFTRLGSCHPCCHVPLWYNVWQFCGYESRIPPLGTPTSY